MRAMGFSEFGGPDVLHVIDRPMPQAGPGEVVVRVAASTVNPTDIMMRSGQQAAMMADLVPPHVPGMEFSGRIHAAGAGVALAPGIPVIGVVNPRRPDGGAHAEYVRVPAASVAALTGDTDLTAAATVPMNALTAMMALELTGLTAGQSLLVTGGPGQFGGFALQLARLAGLRVYANGRPEDATLLRGLGADVVLPRDAGMIEALRALEPAGVDALLDGALIGNAVSAVVRDGGAAVSLRMSHPIKDPRLVTTCVSVIAGLERTDLLERIAALIGDGGLVPRVAQDGVFDWTEAKAAHVRAEAGGFRGRVVLKFGT